MALKKSVSVGMKRILAVVLLTGLGIAQGSYLPVSIQYQLMLKILTFDRNLKIRGENEIMLGIVYRGTWEASSEAKDELVKAMEAAFPRQIDGIPIRYTVVEMRDKNSFAQSVEQNKVNLLYITPLSSDDLKAILSVCRAKRIPTVTGTAAFVENGVAVGFRKMGEKSEILINLSAARDQGFNFSSRLLHLAKIFGRLD
ncbi:MAG: YfiR family protein [Candidatus Aminicenantales bacterium]